MKIRFKMLTLLLALAMLLSCTGVVDCTSMTVNGGTVNVPVEAEEVPALGTVSITTG